MADESTAGGVGTTRGSAVLAPSPQQTSDGRMSVEICPGEIRAACMASAASDPTAAGFADVRTQEETDLARLSVSAVKGASYGR